MKRLGIILAYMLVIALWGVLAWMLRDWYLHRYCSISAAGTWECRR